MFLRLACGAYEGTLQMHGLHVSFFSVQSLIDASHMTEGVRMWVSQWETFISFLLLTCAGRPGPRSLGERKSVSFVLSPTQVKQSYLVSFIWNKLTERSLFLFFFSFLRCERPLTPVLSILDRSFPKLCHHCPPISTIASPPQHSRVSHHYLKPSVKVNFLFGFFLSLFGSSQLSLPFNFLTLSVIFCQSF